MVSKVKSDKNWRTHDYYKKKKVPCTSACENIVLHLSMPALCCPLLGNTEIHFPSKLSFLFFAILLWHGKILLQRKTINLFVTTLLFIQLNETSIQTSNGTEVVTRSRKTRRLYLIFSLMCLEP